MLIEDLKETKEVQDIPQAVDFLGSLVVAVVTIIASRSFQNEIINKKKHIVIIKTRTSSCLSHVLEIKTSFQNFFSNIVNIFYNNLLNLYLDFNFHYLIN